MYTLFLLSFLSLCQLEPKYHPSYGATLAQLICSYGNNLAQSLLAGNMGNIINLIIEVPAMHDVTR